MSKAGKQDEQMTTQNRVAIKQKHEWRKTSGWRCKTGGRKKGEVRGSRGERDSKEGKKERKKERIASTGEESKRNRGRRVSDSLSSSARNCSPEIRRTIRSCQDQQTLTTTDALHAQAAIHNPIFSQHLRLYAGLKPNTGMHRLAEHSAFDLQLFSIRSHVLPRCLQASVG